MMFQASLLSLATRVLVTLGLAWPLRASDSAVPNVVIFITEDQSCDLGILGTKGLDTPSIDNFARGGVNFTRAFALSPVCSPSKMALFTGTYPHTNSAVRNVENYGVQFPLPKNNDPSDLSRGGVHEDLPTLIELLREHQIFTAVTSKSHVQPIRKFPFHKGYVHCTKPKDAERITKDVIKRAEDRPFFLWYNIGSPHLPFKAVPADNGKWDPKGGLLGDGGVNNVDPKEIEVPACYPDVPAVRQDIADYYGAIECIDEIFQRVIDTLGSEGELDNTLIIYTSDHGIGLHRAKQSIYAAGLQIPLLVSGLDTEGGRTITHPVSHLDLSPTVLDYLGIDQPQTMIGKSLRPILNGSENAFPERPTILTACHRYYPARAVTDGKYYYIQNLSQPKGGSLKRPQRVLNEDQYKPGKPWFNRTYGATVSAEGTLPHQLLKQIVEGGLPAEELYDLDNDPWMVRNLINDPRHRSVVPDLKLQLLEWRKISGDTPENLKRRTTPR
ncbi:sulfatase family protein [Haloferula sp.]|uniref:sulfatase family protein n=1 Tax=Haloferula sp. TaxID=2497595 RepID=UPI003C72E2FB